MRNYNPFKYPDVNRNVMSIANLTLNGLLVVSNDNFTLGGGGSYDFSFTSSSRDPLLMLKGLESTTEAVDILMFKNSTYTGGIPGELYNYNFNYSADGIGMVTNSYRKNITVTTDGEIVFTIRLAGDNSTSISGGAFSPLILERDTDYHVRIINTAGGGSKIFDVGLIFGELSVI